MHNAFYACNINGLLVLLKHDGTYLLFNFCSVSVSQTYCPNQYLGLVLAEPSLDVADHGLAESPLD